MQLKGHHEYNAITQIKPEINRVYTTSGIFLGRCYSHSKSIG